MMVHQLSLVSGGAECSCRRQFNVVNMNPRGRDRYELVPLAIARAEAHAASANHRQGLWGGLMDRLRGAK